MSVHRPHLRFLLQLAYCDERMLTSKLRNDIRQVIRREGGVVGGDGADFHSPFWSEAKSIIRPGFSFADAIEARIEASHQRHRLYPLLRDGFLDWWNVNWRGVNEPLNLADERLSGVYDDAENGIDVKVENLFVFRVGQTALHAVYPYFSEEPVLSAQAARVGLWLIHETLPNLVFENVEILDVLRGRSFSVRTHPLQGDEHDIYQHHVRRILRRWNELRATY